MESLVYRYEEKVLAAGGIDRGDKRGCGRWWFDCRADRLRKDDPRKGVKHVFYESKAIYGWRG
ncbi:hypothetical protein M1N53_00595 [Thermodesulfovibrionales bacterium]|nr:hypothetical protein [Thermodesulfovibrionales bacterium]MCL0038159.1 hypothetical protein [Thermodesulfovibrionales bacterium]MCL0066968.1 hypothetical protein [Thermodesulfovibrionales bacterium]MCL0074642.1 hypothetical protein [Thermodesulfovibrionales bacterium]